MIAIIIFGPPGSGKGTQAQLLAEKLNLVHFDSGSYLRQVYYNPKYKKNKIVQKEKRLSESGKLNTPEWVLRIITDKTKKIEKLNESVIFSGSPRTLFEAFGDKKHKGLMKILEGFYGKKNIRVFILNISEKESIRRNSKRIICSICRTPMLSQMSNAGCQMSNCPFCAGPLKSRFDDKKEIIIERLKEYQMRTFPIIKELKKKKYKVIGINGRQLPYKIHKKIMSLV
ncbi:MAG: nucleoside monophosphate kinase [Patescibacteria group bacterium]